MKKRYVYLDKNCTMLNTNTDFFDMADIKNRRFMFNPGTGTLILGREFSKSEKIFSSHAEEHAESKTAEPYDDFIRGWIGKGGDYPQGVIHFAPNIPKDAPEEVFNRAYDTVKMFQANGATDRTVVRGFGKEWEQLMSDINVQAFAEQQTPFPIREQLKQVNKQPSPSKPKPREACL